MDNQSLTASRPEPTGSRRGTSPGVPVYSDDTWNEQVLDNATTCSITKATPDRLLSVPEACAGSQVVAPGKSRGG